MFPVSMALTDFRVMLACSANAACVRPSRARCTGNVFDNMLATVVPQHRSEVDHNHARARDHSGQRKGMCDVGQRESQDR
jgi:hypothetical protein